MDNKDYNTQREKLIMPEYGRHVQDMINYVANIPDKKKRDEQIQAVVAVMGTLNPQLRDIVDFRHKLWDHVQIISDFKIDIDSPYPIPTRETIATKPSQIPLQKTPVRAACYGRNIQNMIDLITSHPDDDVKKYMIKVIASYMKQQYLIWNKDSVSEETIYEDIHTLSGGKITVPSDIHIGMGQVDTNARNPRSGNNQNNNNRNSGSHNKKGKLGSKKWKKITSSK
ncbi:MAG TPA: DUF4290 domain-containing protein [Candidatus Egerieousia sp.]|nr:DUF4290 domain-containing protein [Candidatus Egerieousia sp.]HPT05614.1 DUF4290 domain-containing protein [Candidatus Egerieousia sp.]